QAKQLLKRIVQQDNPCNTQRNAPASSAISPEMTEQRAKYRKPRHQWQISNQGHAQNQGWQCVTGGLEWRKKNSVDVRP
ncbi:hypothetical protein, partial [Klebsiella quasipneumoniae]|uniref:hypothetical protein n=1 Tax=Klebsiella quasipneumoniae TaxID=1463165 RepID=UPI0027318B46